MASVTSSKDSQKSHSDNCIPVEKRFLAMGSETMISIMADNAVSAHATNARTESAIIEFEHRFSRFLPNSELSHLNATEGDFHASDAMFRILTTAQEWYKKTDGIFDPTIIGALETFGYDKSLDFTRGPVSIHKELNISEYEKRFIRRTPFSSLVINVHTGIVRVPHGLRIDLGGIGKGYIIDACSDNIVQTHAHFWLSAGGDVCVAGNNCGEPWSVGVQDPFNPEHDIGFITIEKNTRAALATSGIIKRKGSAGNFEWHHLINPKTGLPARTDIVAVTVLTSTATAADILAKTVLILGKEKGLAHIRLYPDTACLIIDTQKNIIMSDSMHNYFSKNA